MKKSTINILAASVLILVSLASCKKQLEKYPYNAIELSQSFQSVKDAKTWNNGLYSNFRAAQYGEFMFPTDVQADQLNATKDYGNRNGFPHRWDGFLAGDYTIENVWSRYYYNITNINIAIDGFSTISTSTPAEEKELNQYKGDAHLARAFYYFRLVQLFSKAYDQADPLGVPLILKYDTELKPARSSVKEVYDQILLDISEAKTLLAGVNGTAGAIRFTKDVALALEARVKLNMLDFPGAKAAADALIATGTYPLITDATAFQNYWHIDGKQESILQLFISKPNELANTNSIYLGFNAGTGKYTPDFIPSKWVIDEYDVNDIRKNAYFKDLPTRFTGISDRSLTLVNKYPGNPAYFTTAATNYEHEPKVFRIAEMYLISAEAGARGQGLDGLTPLNALREARGLNNLSGLTGNALFEAVKEERFRELAFEGFRLFDLKRWHSGFNRKDPQDLAAIQTGASYETLTINADADKFTWGIPSQDKTINPNIVQNKGW